MSDTTPKCNECSGHGGFHFEGCSYKRKTVDLDVKQCPCGQFISGDDGEPRPDLCASCRPAGPAVDALERIEALVVENTGGFGLPVEAREIIEGLIEAARPSSPPDEPSVRVYERGMLVGQYNLAASRSPTYRRHECGTADWNRRKLSADSDGVPTISVPRPPDDPSVRLDAVNPRTHCPTCRREWHDEAREGRERFEKALEAFDLAYTSSEGGSRSVAHITLLRLYDEAASRSPAPPKFTEADVQELHDALEASRIRVERVLRDYASRQGEK